MDTLESIILKNLKGNQDKRLSFILERIEKEYPVNRKPSRKDLLQILWSFVGRGLVYIDPHRGSPENWDWQLTEYGQKSVEEKQFNPDDPKDIYLTFMKNPRNRFDSL